MIISDFKYVFLYLLLPVLIFLFILSKKKVKKILLLFAKDFSIDKSYKRLSLIRNLSIIFLFVSLSFLIFSMMQPRWGLSEQELKTENYMITIMLDLSRSMDATDVFPSRLERAKLEIEKFIKSADNISVSLVGFAGTSFIASPFTEDFDTLTYILQTLSTKSVSLQGTRIADALITARNTFNINNDDKKSIILITDGEDHFGSFDSILKELKKMKISIYTIGVGSEKGSTVISHVNPDSRTIISKRDDKTLEYLANETGGKSYISANISLNNVFEDIKKNMKSVSSIRNTKDYKDRYQIFLSISIIFIIISIVLNLCTQISFSNKNRKLDVANE